MRPPESDPRRKLIADWLGKAHTDQPEPTVEETRLALDLARQVRDAVLPLLAEPSAPK